MLSAYQYNIRNMKRSNNDNADALSRLPLPLMFDGVIQPTEIVFIDATTLTVAL